MDNELSHIIENVHHLVQVLRMDANMPFARTPGIGAVFANALAAAVKAGGCRNLWHLRITLEDFDNAFFTIPRTSGHSAGLGRRRAAQPLERSSAGENVGDEREDKKRRGSKATAAVVARHTSIPPPRSGPVHPMNALALARAFHPRAPNGGAGASLLDNRGTHAAGYDSRGRAGQARGAITSLELPYARLHLQTVEVIATHAISSLTNLDLTYCYIGPAGARALARALDAGNAANSDGDSSSVGARGRGSTSLRSLRMPHNAIGDSGAHAFSYALKTNRCLTFLSLASNGIGPAGGRTLASALRGEGIALTQLDIGDNPLGESSARMLVLAAVDTHKARDDGGHGGATRLQISGLDEVAGVSVAMKETMRRAARGGVTSATNAEGVDKDSAGIIPTRRVAWGDSVSRDEHEAPSLLQVGPAVSLRPDDADQDDGFIQVTRGNCPRWSWTVEGSTGGVKESSERLSLLGDRRCFARVLVRLKPLQRIFSLLLARVYPVEVTLCSWIPHISLPPGVSSTARLKIPIDRKGREPRGGDLGHSMVVCIHQP